MVESKMMQGVVEAPSVESRWEPIAPAPAETGSP